MAECTDVLIVDDDPDLLPSMDAALSGAGYLVSCAGDGGEALASLAAATARGDGLPKVIILDLHLPLVSGFHVLKQLRAHTAYSRIPVLVMASAAEAGDLAGAGGFLPKPFSLAQLLEAVEPFVRDRRPPSP